MIKYNYSLIRGEHFDLQLGFLCIELRKKILILYSINQSFILSYI